MMAEKSRETLFAVGLATLTIILVWSPACYHLYRNSWNFDAGHAVPIGFGLTLMGGLLSMSGRGWKRLPIALITICDLLFWWFFGMMAGWS
jgi:hypothetical protein